MEEPKNRTHLRACVCVPLRREGRRSGARGSAGGYENGWLALAREEKKNEPSSSRDTEGTCYALKDMTEACGIHNSVKTKMLWSCCLGEVAFFLVSRNVQLLIPRLFSAPVAALAVPIVVFLRRATETFLRL